MKNINTSSAAISVRDFTLDLDEYEANHLMVVLRDDIDRARVVFKNIKGNSAMPEIDRVIIGNYIKRSQKLLKKLGALAAAEGRG